MIIKSHIRGGYRAAADYMKEQGQNEKTRLIEISDPSAKNLDQAFQKMWEVASATKCKKPLHHISINPMKDERLTDAQVLAIVSRCEEKYGYQMFHHQRVIVEHVKDGRQHFHVIWNRVSLVTGRTVWPGHHWLKSKEVCREMEKELELKSPTPRQSKHGRALAGNGKARRHTPGSKANGVRQSGRSRMTSAHLPAMPKLHIPRFKTPREERPNPPPMPMRPMPQPTGWPLAAIFDWKNWGRRDPRAFFRKWPELAS
ncbi:MAG: relaxase/mobilization nuclease domain-containing protein [Alphaproteobacteria bacterium]